MPSEPRSAAAPITRAATPKPSARSRSRSSRPGAPSRLTSPIRPAASPNRLPASRTGHCLPGAAIHPSAAVGERQGLLDQLGAALDLGGELVVDRLRCGDERLAVGLV